MATYACSVQDAAKVSAIVGDSIAAQICKTQDVAATGAEGAVLRYLASKPTVEALQNQAADITFVLFSAYLVFLMQSGFAMVSLRQDTGSGLIRQPPGLPAC